MKTVLCYGDSLTWGFSPGGSGRHAYGDRWPSVLQAGLGDAALVIPEGLNGRTTIFDDYAAGADRNGARILPTILMTHTPVDLVIIMLGSNDMKPWFAAHAQASKQGMQRLVDIIRGHDYPLDDDPPDILLAAPPVLCETADPDFAAMFGPGIAQSKMLATLYSDLADEIGCGFFDAGSVAQASPLDGVHLDAENTRAIGRGIEPVARMMLGL
ncbi:MAG: SGNH/GDSL hydrolase family protein [Hyphomicrobiales bacterium]|nr:SGNH/GDSL hydrolase family protein [Hyphomicrobiales bacterium]